MKRISHLLTLLLGALVATPVLATQWLSSNSVGNADERTITVTENDVDYIVRVRAYSTQTASTTSATASSGMFTSTANLALFGGGFGIGNTITGDTNEGTPPEHAVDNNQIFDVLVFELPAAGFDLEAFRLGWAQEGSTGGAADMSVFFGGNNLGANFDFSQACFSGCANSLTDSSLFTNLTNTGALVRNDNSAVIGSAPDNNVPQNVIINAPGGQQGRYLVMAGALGGSNDNFKVDMIQASGVIPPGGHTPEPGILALFLLGLFGLAAFRRRQHA